MLDFTKDDSCLLVIFNGGKLPKSYDPAMLVKMLQENDGTADPYFGLTKDGMITLNYAIDNRGVTADRVKQAITTMSDYAGRVRRFKPGCPFFRRLQCRLREYRP